VLEAIRIRASPSDPAEELKQRKHYRGRAALQRRAGCSDERALALVVAFQFLNFTAQLR
jgi:hypothetical protein